MSTVEWRENKRIKDPGCLSYSINTQQMLLYKSQAGNKDLSECDIWREAHKVQQPSVL